MKEEFRFISLAEAAKITNYSQDYISLLCRQGKIKAQKLGRNWVTTREWVQSYVDNSNGTGASIIPVKIKSDKIEDFINRVEKTKAVVVENVEKRNSFYGRSVLEFALFCFFSILIIGNFYAFAFYTYTEEFSDPVALAQNYSLPVLETGEVAGVSTMEEHYQNEEDAEILASYTIIEIHTDISGVSKEDLIKEIQEDFSEEIEAEIFDGYAVVSYKNNPEKRFLYVER
jgi:hypothetical protein